MKAMVGSFFLVAILVYIGFGFFLYIKQRSFIYFPQVYPSIGYQESFFQNEGETIGVTVLHPGKGRAIIYFGGNAENVDSNAVDFSTVFPGYTVYLFKYRGYGSSTGRPTEQGIYSDALFVFDALLKNHVSISVMGRSLGSGVATYLGSNREIDKLVLVTPFDSVRNVAQGAFPVYPIGWLLKDHYDSASRIEKMSAKTLIVAAEFDEVINRKHTENLANAFNSEDLAYKVINGRGHNDLSDSKAYYGALKKFLSYH